MPDWATLTMHHADLTSLVKVLKRFRQLERLNRVERLAGAAFCGRGPVYLGHAGPTAQETPRHSPGEDRLRDGVPLAVAVSLVLEW